MGMVTLRMRKEVRRWSEGSRMCVDNLSKNKKKVLDTFQLQKVMQERTNARLWWVP